MVAAGVEGELRDGGGGNTRAGVGVAHEATVASTVGALGGGVGVAEVAVTTTL